MMRLYLVYFRSSDEFSRAVEFLLGSPYSSQGPFAFTFSSLLLYFVDTSSKHYHSRWSWEEEYFPKMTQHHASNTFSKDDSIYDCSKLNIILIKQ